MDIVDRTFNIIIIWVILELLIRLIFKTDNFIFSAEFIMFCCIISGLNQINKSIQGLKNGSDSN